MRTALILTLAIATAPAIAQTASREPAGVTPPSFTAPHAEVPASASPFKFSGFANFGYATQSSGFNILDSDARSISGFNLSDASFYANYEKDRVSVYLDIASRRQYDKDRNPSAASPDQSSNNSFGIGVERSQFYLKYRLNDSWAFNLGQFDTIFGVELNDAKDRFFNKTGLDYDELLPVTHTGAMIEYARDGFYVKSFAANPNNQGSYGNNPSTGSNTEYGIATGYGNEHWHAQLGYMARPVRTAAGKSQGTRSLGDFVIGGVLGKLAVDVAYTLLDDPAKNSLTPTNNGDREDAGTAIFVLATYKFTDKFSLGARFESLDHDPAGDGRRSATAEGLGAHYKLTPELELRSEILGTQTKALSTDYDGRRFELSILASF